MTKDEKYQRVNDFLGMSPDEQMDHYGMQQVREPKEQDVCPECRDEGVIYESHPKQWDAENCEKVPCPSCTVKAPVDKIREAFECELNKSDDDYLNYSDYDWFRAGYKSRQAEIERLKGLLDKSQFGVLKTKIGVLKDENEAMRNGIVKLTTKYRQLGDSGALFIINELKELIKENN